MKTSAIWILCLTLLSACTASPAVIPSNTTPPTHSIETAPTINTPTATATPVQVNCPVNPNDVPFMTPDFFMVYPEQTGLCQLSMRMSTPIEYSLLFPSGWETSLLGPAEGTNRRGWVGFQPEANSNLQISVWAQFAELPSLKGAESEIENDDTVLQEKSTRTIGDKLVLETLSARGDQTVKRYFIRYDSNDKNPARLFVFEISIPTAQFDQPESQEILKDFEAMVAAFKY